MQRNAWFTQTRKWRRGRKRLSAGQIRSSRSNRHHITRREIGNRSAAGRRWRRVIVALQLDESSPPKTRVALKCRASALIRHQPPMTTAAGAASFIIITTTITGGVFADVCSGHTKANQTYNEWRYKAPRVSSRRVNSRAHTNNTQKRWTSAPNVRFVSHTWGKTNHRLSLRLSAMMPTVFTRQQKQKKSDVGGQLSVSRELASAWKRIP